MTHEALRCIPARLSLGSKARSVRTHAPAEGRVARQAVALRVARGAVLEALPGRAPVLQQPEWLRVMKGDVEPSLRRQA
jgi:hypothetical protein